MNPKQYMSFVAEMPCLICGRPAEVHHILEGRFGQRKSSDYHTIPLCPEHHRTGGVGVAIHAGPRTWREAHGSELRHASIVQQIMETQYGAVIPEEFRVCDHDQVTTSGQPQKPLASQKAS